MLDCLIHVENGAARGSARRQSVMLRHGGVFREVDKETSGDLEISWNNRKAQSTRTHHRCASRAAL